MTITTTEFNDIDEIIKELSGYHSAVSDFDLLISNQERAEEKINSSGGKISQEKKKLIRLLMPGVVGSKFTVDILKEYSNQIDLSIAELAQIYFNPAFGDA